MAEPEASGSMEVEEKYLDDAVRILLKKGGHCFVWLFYGDLGSGKTTVIKKVCEALGVSGGMSSPTFSLVNEYAGDKGKIYHMDFYRVKNAEVFDLGVEEYFESGSYCFVEWPDRLGNWRPEKYLEVHLSVNVSGSRYLEYQMHG